MKGSRRHARGPQSHLARLDRAEVGKLEQITAEMVDAARLTAARYARDEDDLVLLLDVLGLLPASTCEETA